MNNNTIIIIDSCSDLPFDFVKSKNIPFVPYTYTFKGEILKDDFGQTVDYKTFYDRIRAGEMVTTSQVTVEEYASIFRTYLEKNYSVIFLSFSAILSGSYNNALMAKDMLLEEYPDADLTIIDTKSISLGEGLVVYYAVKMLEEGASKDEIINWVEENRLRVNHWFTVDDLNFLERGGRITKEVAQAGTLLDIKPIFKLDNEGKLVSVLKAKGMKKAIRTLVSIMEERVENPEEQVISIAHSDSIENAKYLASLVRERFNVKDIIIGQMGAVIGAHGGPGCIGLNFLGKARDLK